MKPNILEYSTTQGSVDFSEGNSKIHMRFCMTQDGVSRRHSVPEGLGFWIRPRSSDVIFRIFEPHPSLPRHLRRAKPQEQLYSCNPYYQKIFNVSH